MMRWNRSLFYMWIAVFGLLTPTFADNESTYDLHPQFLQGQTARYGYFTERITHTVVTAFDETEQATQGIQSQGEVLWTVDQVQEDGSARCTLVYQFIELTITDPQGEQHVNDTRRDSGAIAEVHALLRAFIDAPITVHIAPDGTVERMDGLEAIQNKLDNPDMMPKRENLIETVIDLAYLLNAPADAQVGDTWQSASDGSHEFGDLARNAQWTFAQVEILEGIPVASVQGTYAYTLTPDLSDLPDDAPDVDIRLTDGSGTTLVLYDLDRNEVVGRVATYERLFQIAIPLGPTTLQQEITEQGQFQLWREAEE